MGRRKPVGCSGLALRHIDYLTKFGSFFGVDQFDIARTFALWAKRTSFKS